MYIGQYVLPTEPCDHNGIGRTDWQFSLPGGRLILLKEDEGDREIFVDPEANPGREVVHVQEPEWTTN